LIKTAHQHLLLLVGFNTLIYRKYYDTPPILVGHQSLCWRLRSSQAIGMGFVARISAGLPVAEASANFLLLESAVSILSVSFHLMQWSLRDPRLWSLFVSRETRPSSSGVSKKLGWAAALPKWRARAELGWGAPLAAAAAVDCVPGLIGLILRVPDLAGAVVFAGAAGLVGTEVFSVEGVLGAACSGVADVGHQKMVPG
jgi:hypothetical protein